MKCDDSVTVQNHLHICRFTFVTADPAQYQQCKEFRMYAQNTLHCLGRQQWQMGQRACMHAWSSMSCPSKVCMLM